MKVWIYTSLISADNSYNTPCVRVSASLPRVNTYGVQTMGLLYKWLTEAESHWCDYEKAFGLCDDSLQALRPFY